MRIGLHLLSLVAALSAVAVALGAGSAMQTHHVDVAGSRVSIDLHPSFSPPGSLPPREGVSASRIAEPGSRVEFVNLMYDYKRRWRLEVDGAVIVIASAARRAAVLRDAGISFLDTDRWLAELRRRDPKSHYEKIEREGRPWLLRTTLNDVKPGLGRSEKREWLVPVTEDISLLIEVTLSDYATKASRTDASWYATAAALHRHIFESVRVEPPAAQGKP